MNNPYQVLNVHQDATKEEIHKAFVKAQIECVKSKAYSGKEIMEAQKQLLDPAKRLVADFLFFSRIKSKRLKKIDLAGLDPAPSFDIDSLINKYDSLDASKRYE